MQNPMNLFSTSLFFIFFLFFLPPSLSLPPFPHNITLFGDAHFLNSSLILTHQHPCTSPPSHPPSPVSPSPVSPPSGVGRAYLHTPIRFLDSSKKLAKSFSCSFSFTITSDVPCPYGDGLAFMVASNVEALSVPNGSMGLPDDGKDWFFAVEFDTNFDSYLGDVNNNHIGVDVGSVKSLGVVDAVSNGVDLMSGRELSVWIEYRSFEGLVQVWVGFDSRVRPKIPVLEEEVHVLGKFEEFMYVGFSAANGKGSAIHSVNRWRFKTFDSFLSNASMPMELDEEDDCLICKPGEINKLKHSNDLNHVSNRLTIIVLVFGGLAGVSSVVVCVVCVWFRLRRYRQNAKNEGQLLRFQGGRVLKRMSLSEIKAATKDFNQTRIIGAGGSAVVYEGEIPSRGSVAVKRFSKDSKLFNSSLSSTPFNTEFGTMVGCLRHKNLIQLQGWCCEKKEFVLVYEFMGNGSLDKILHKNTYFTKYLTWERRLNIVLGVASALIYLHEECESQIIHRDVKTCNIMLDEKFNAKLADFGLAEVYNHDCGPREATVPAGTMGYLAPEYAFSGIPTVKTDVFSFGIVVLEVATGRKPVDEEGTVITEWVWTLWEMGKLIEVADNKLMGKFDGVEMERMLTVGLFCAHPDQGKRPTMREAARMLTGEAPLPVFPQTRPTIRIQSVSPSNVSPH